MYYQIGPHSVCITTKPLNRISPYNININQMSDENKEKNQFVDKVDKLINTKFSEPTL